jgi:hypothetical protein
VCRRSEGPSRSGGVVVGGGPTRRSGTGPAAGRKARTGSRCAGDGGARSGATSPQQTLFFAVLALLRGMVQLGEATTRTYHHDIATVLAAALDPPAPP